MKGSEITTKLSTKGQLIIRKEIRQHHNWLVGCEHVVEDRGTHVEIRQAREVPKTTLADVVGATGYQGPRRSLEEMEAAIAAGAREHR